MIFGGCLERIRDSLFLFALFSMGFKLNVIMDYIVMSSLDSTLIEIMVLRQIF